MRTWIGLSVVLALFVAGCGGQQRAEKEKAAPDVVDPQGTGTQEKPVRIDAASEWQELANRLRQHYQVTEQQKSTQADEHYRLAERYYQAGDFEKAELECEKALKLNTDHAPAHALWLEVQFILGRAKATPRAQEYERYRDEAVVRHEQTLLEIDHAFARGTAAYNVGDYDDAERAFRKILEFAKWMPTGVELETRRRQALEMLERTKEARRQRSLDEERQRQRMIEDEKSREELKRRIHQKRELELLFGQAQLHFEREEYALCEEICDRILYINPNLTSVAEMRNVAQRLKHDLASRKSLKDYIEQWKRTFEHLEILSSLQGQDLEFPDHETWLERIASRKPKGISDLEESISIEDSQIIDKLKSIKITIDMTDASLAAIIDYIREISGLNIVIDTQAIPDPGQVTIPPFKVSDVVLEGALRLLLQPLDKAHVVTGGVVSITSTDAIKSQVKLELYDVQDLTYGIQDFPGVDIALSQDQIGTTVTAEEGARQQFTGEDLADLIRNTIHKDEWDEVEGKSIIFNNGLLIVRNSIAIHRAITKFLGDLRASTSMLVSVEVRFLSVEDTFLQQVGMDFRDLDGPRVRGLTTLNDINPPFLLVSGLLPQFIEPTTGQFGPGANTAGFATTWGTDVTRAMGGRVQHIMANDFIIQKFYREVIRPTGGGTMQFTLLDDISLETIIRLVSRSERNHVLTAPKLTLFNTQRGNVRIANQMAYIRDFDVQIATASVVLDPVVDVVSDGISLDVRPIVSADRKFVTLELRPTVATLFPAPPNIFFIVTNVAVPGAPVTDALPVRLETPIIHVQRIRTTAVVPDRGTLLLGGLTIVFDERTDASIPIWRGVPILGNLGSEKVKGLQRKQLLCIVKVRIIIPDEEERRRF